MAANAAGWPFTPSTGVQIPLGTPKISLRYRSVLLLQSVVYRRMFTKCLAGLQPAGHFHFQQLFGCDPYTALAQSVHHDCELSRNLRISVTKLENGARHFSAVGTVIA